MAKLTSRIIPNLLVSALTLVLLSGCSSAPRDEAQINNLAMLLSLHGEAELCEWHHDSIHSNNQKNHHSNQDICPPDKESRESKVSVDEHKVEYKPRIESTSDGISIIVDKIDRKSIELP